jgi:hypothetical protein
MEMAHMLQLRGCRKASNAACDTSSGSCTEKRSTMFPNKKLLALAV